MTWFNILRSVIKYEIQNEETKNMCKIDGKYLTVFLTFVFFQSNI